MDINNLPTETNDNPFIMYSNPDNDISKVKGTNDNPFLIDDSNIKTIPLMHLLHRLFACWLITLIFYGILDLNCLILMFWELYYFNKTLVIGL